MDNDYIQFISLINRKLGIDLNLYKKAQMKRRITSLKNKRGFDTFLAYYNSLEQNDDLLKEFVDRLTINVSEFYRNPKRWDILKEKVLPYLVKNKNKLTVWSAACSTGEEPYSIAILLEEYFPQIRYKILATDIDEKVLNNSEKGLYQERALKDLPVILKNKYFTKKDNLYYIKESLKQGITFEKHNLLADLYPQNLDLIVCRNVLIYFNDVAKDMLYQKFSKSLVQNGILFVGSTEQIFSPQAYHFSIFDTFFYKKKE